jgi:phosphoglycerate dehydrogenase-like enzyme
MIPFTGVPESARELLIGFPGIAVHNCGFPAAPTAEMAMTLLLAAAKFIVPIDRAFRAHDWTPRHQPNPALLLEGRTALLLGYGRIGQRVARVCHALGMRVLAIRRRPEASTPAHPPVEVQPLESLHALLPAADALVIALPLTPDTRGLIGAAELALLPPQAVLVNVGRGPIVDEAALYHALHSRKIAAAGLDVWYNYPADESSRSHTPPSRFPFHELDNVVMSPHRAGGSSLGEEPFVIELAAQLNAAARGEALANRVDVRAGY